MKFARRFGAVLVLALVGVGVGRADDVVASPTAKDDGPLRQKLLRLNGITGEDVVDGQVRELIEKPDDARKMIALAATMTKAAKEPPFQYNAALVLGRTALILKQYDASETFLKMAAEQAANVRSSHKLLGAYDSLITLSQITKKFDQALRYCQELLEKPGDEQFQKLKPLVLEKLIEIKARQGKYEEALEMAEELVKASKGSFYFLFLKARVQREASKFEDAVQTTLDTVEKIKKFDGLEEDEKDGYINRCHYFLSGVYTEMDQIDKAAEHLQTLMKKKPDNSTYSNDLGYIWADRGLHLDEAERLIRKAIEDDRTRRKAIAERLPPEFNKDNAAYLDSLGWVLFKKKQYPEAKKYLLEAVKDEDDGQHIEIFDHLADVHMALGERTEAVAVWKKALELEPLSKRDKKRLDEVRAKLKTAEGK